MNTKMMTTYSMWSKFRNCRKACEWRYIKELVPLERDPSLAFGSVIHACLELWHRHRDLERVLAHINGAYPDRGGEEKQKADWNLATAMMKGYAARYPTEEFEVVGLEAPFEGPIVNPATGAASRSFTLAGKIDGIVKKDGQYFLLEHKTASLIDSGYLERLWGDAPIEKWDESVLFPKGVPAVKPAKKIAVKARGKTSASWSKAVFAPKLVSVQPALQKPRGG